MRISWFGTAFAASLLFDRDLAPCNGQNLGQAWDIALHVNQLLQSQQAQSMAAGLNLKAAKSDRLPRIRNFTADAFLTNPRNQHQVVLGIIATGTRRGIEPGRPGRLPSAVSILGPGQTNLPISLTYATVPLYTGGQVAPKHRCRRSSGRRPAERGVSDRPRSQAHGRRSLHRGPPGEKTSKSPRAMWSSSPPSLAMSRTGGERAWPSATKSSAAQVSLANARLAEIQAVTSLQSARATYNRYLCRPLNEVVHLEELTVSAHPPKIGRNWPNSRSMTTSPRH